METKVNKQYKYVLIFWVLLTWNPTLLNAQLYYSDDSSTRKTYNQALFLMGEERFDESLHLLKTITQQNPDFLEAFKSIVILYKKMDHLDEALQYLQDYNQGAIIKTGSSYGLSVYHLEKKSFQEAEKILKELIENHKTHYMLHRLLVDCYRASNQLSLCQQFLHNRLKVDSLNLSLYYALGYLKIIEQEYGEAIPYFNHIIQKDASFLPASAEKAHALLRISEFKNAEQLCKQILDIIQEKQWKEEEGYLWNMLGNIYNGQGDIKETIKSFTQASQIYKQIGDRKHLSVIQINLGMMYNRLGQYRNALHLLNSCRSYFKAEGDTAQYAASLGQIGWVFFNQANYDSALGYFLPAAKLSEQTKEFRFSAFWNRFLGLTQQNKGNFLEALNYFRQAFQFAVQAEHTAEQARNLDRIGRIFYEIGHIDSAKIYYEQALHLLHQSGDRFFEAVTLANLSMIENDAGHFSHGLEYCERALRISQEIGDKREQANYLDNISCCYAKLGNFRAAEKILRQALELAHSLQAGAYEIHLLNNLSQIYLDLEESDNQLSCLEKALKLARHQEMKSFEVKILNSLGTFYLMNECYGDAEKHIKNSLVLAEQYKMDHDLPLILLNLGRLQRKQKNLNLSEKTLYQALDLAKRRQDISSHMQAYRELGLLYHEMDSLTKALTCYEKAIDHIEEIRSSIVGQDFRISYFEEKTRLFDELVDILAELHHSNPQNHYIDQAFHYSERSKSRALLDLLQLNKTGSGANIPNSLMVESKKAEQGVSAIQSQLSEFALDPGSSSASLDSLEKELTAAKNRLEKIKKKVDQYRWKDLPLLARGRPLKLNEICNRILKSNHVLLEYIIGYEQSYAFIVRDQHLAIIELPITESTLQSEIEAFRRPFLGISDPTSITFNTKLAHTLYCQLVKPLESHLREGDQLLIVPDDVLFYLPFEALIVDPKIESIPQSAAWYANYGQFTYLLEKYSISYAGSASLLDPQLLHPSRKLAPKDSILAVGMPLYNQEKPSQLAMRQKQDWLLRPLPFSEYEIEQIGTSFTKTRILKGTDATEEIIKANAGYYRYLHFSTHGLLDEQQPLYSGLTLTLDADPAEDGFFQMYEILDLKLNADLVTLSACGTGLGALKKGEGVIGLTQAFLTAGSRSVVVSLWNVADASTAQLMGDFYHYLEQGLSKVEALRQAKLNLIKSTGNLGNVQVSYAHPFFWAPFVLVGDTQPLDTVRKHSFKWIGFLGLGILILFGVILYVRRRNPQ